MFCVYCGSKNPNFGDFCSICGKGLYKNDAESQSRINPDESSPQIPTSTAYAFAPKDMNEYSAEYAIKTNDDLLLLNQQRDDLVPAAQSALLTELQSRDCLPTGNLTGQTSADSGLKGVGGWLLFLCVMLTVVNPLLIGITLANEIYTVVQREYVEDWLWRLVWAEMILGSLVILFGVYAGMALWKVRPHAVQFALTYIVILPLYVIALEVVAIVVVPNATALSFDGVAIGRSLVGAIIWMAYLQRSVRVRNTYPDAA
jgi:hypothetical protein